MQDLFFVDGEWRFFWPWPVENPTQLGSLVACG